MEPLENVSPPQRLDEHLDTHRAIWRLQPVLLVVMALVAAGSLAGLFSDGWLSRATTGDARAEIVYERFVRFGKAFVVEVRLNELPADVVVPLAYLADFRLHGVVPEPASHRVAGAAVHYAFDADGHTVVRFYLEPLNPGVFTGVWTLDGTQVAVKHLTYP